MPVLALLWTWYPLTVAAIVAWVSLVATTPGASSAAFVALHVGVTALALVTHHSMKARTKLTQRVVWSVFTFGGLPTVFSSLGMVLPMIHPEPWEWWCIRCDRVLWGRDPIPVLQSTLHPLFVEVLQACYASFYLLPIAALVGIAIRRRGAHFDRALALVAFGFQASYLGYLVWPTLGPNRLGLWDAPVTGLWVAEHLHNIIEQLEANLWDCFPSGHTMLSVLAVWIAFWGLRWLAWTLLPIAICIVYATMALRYHYAADVAAGIAGALSTIALSPLLRAPLLRETLLRETLPGEPRIRPPRPSPTI